MNVFEVKPIPPYLITPHLERFSLENEPLPHIYKDRSCRRVLYLNGENIPYKVFIIREGSNPLIRITIYSKDDKKTRKTLDIIKEIYRINFNYNDFIEKIKNIKEIYNIIMEYNGLRPTRILNTYEALIDSIIEQNISLKLAMRVKSQFIRNLGIKKIVNGEIYYGFPTPDKLSTYTPEELREIVKLTRVKANAIIEVARRYKELPTPNEIETDPDNYIEFITEIKGIGRWTAEISAAKVSKNFRVGPFTDLSVKRAFKIFLGTDNEKMIKKIIEDVKEYTGLILYLMAF